MQHSYLAPASPCARRFNSFNDDSEEQSQLVPGIEPTAWSWESTVRELQIGKLAFHLLAVSHSVSQTTVQISLHYAQPH